MWPDKNHRSPGNKMPRTSLFTLLFAAIMLPPAAGRAADLPDIVLVMTDDMGYSDLGCYGGEIETPNIDQLAAGGLRFTNFYSENMCWVSRAAMLTGVWHLTSFNRGGLHPRCVSIPEVLRESGYSTLMSGKWHLGDSQRKSSPTDRGFDSFYGIIDGASSFFAPASLMRDKQPIEVSDLPADYYITDAISDNAVEYIRKADRKKPLLLYVAYTAAHWPLHALPKDIERYKGRYSMGWDKLREKRYRRMKELGIISADTPLSPRHPNVPPWEKAEHKDWQERRMEVYAAQVTSMDAGIGRIVKALQQRGNFDNTLFLYMTDNGGCHVEYGTNRKGSYLPEKTRDGRKMKPGNIPGLMPGPEITYQSYGYGWANVSNTPYRLFKQFDHEGGIRTPLIAHWPRGIASRGGLTGQVAHLVDILPTLVEITGARLPASSGGSRRIAVNGRSLAAVFQGKKRQGHQSIFFSHNKGRAIREGKWKLVQVKRKKNWELYDLDKDPAELQDLAREEPEIAAGLKARWTAWAKQQANQESPVPAAPTRKGK